MAILNKLHEAITDLEICDSLGSNNSIMDLIYQSIKNTVEEYLDLREKGLDEEDSDFVGFQDKLYSIAITLKGLNNPIFKDLIKRSFAMMDDMMVKKYQQ